MGPAQYPLYTRLPWVRRLWVARHTDTTEDRDATTDEPDTLYFFTSRAFFHCFSLFFFVSLIFSMIFFFSSEAQNLIFFGPQFRFDFSGGKQKPNEPSFYLVFLLVFSSFFRFLDLFFCLLFFLAFFLVGFFVDLFFALVFFLQNFTRHLNSLERVGTVQNTILVKWER